MSASADPMDPRTVRSRTVSRNRFARIVRDPVAIVALTLALIVVGVALVGPALAPHSISEPIGPPGAGPTSAAPLGTDFLGRDVLSRVLHGGASVLGVSLLANLLVYALGIAVGMSAGLSRSWLDPLLMRSVDVFLVFPPLLLILLMITGLGSGYATLIAGIVVVLFPGVARLVRAATLEVSTNAYIEAAVARGETTMSIMFREVLPNIAPTIIADVGGRFSYVVILAASVNFLGLGSAPPAADWGLMVAENLQVLSSNVWAVLAPAILLALLTVSVNLLGDVYVRDLGRSKARS